MLAMRNPRAPHIDFGFLRGLIPSNPKAMPCNIDMVFERKSKFLFGEWKRPSESVSLGQEILLMNLSKNPAHTVLLITGNTDDNQVVVSDITKMIDSKYIKIGNNVEDLKEILNQWYIEANKL